MASENDPTSAELSFGSGYYEQRLEERLQELRKKKIKAFSALRKKQEIKAKNIKKRPPSLFDDLDLFAADYENPASSPSVNGEMQKKAERAVLRAEKARQKREKMSRNTEAAIAAFEAGDWNAGYKLAGNADWHDPRIQYWLGRFYEEGFMLERDSDGSVEFYRDAAEHGHEDAKHRLERMHIECQKSSSPEEAEWVSWKRCREAAERGDAEAQAVWGTILFFDGKYEEAREWHVKAEKQNNAKALYSIGRALESGCLIDNGKNIALQYYRNAAKLITDTVNTYSSLFKGKRTEKDILYMALIHIALRYEKESNRNDTAPYSDILKKLTSEIEETLNS